MNEYSTITKVVLSCWTTYVILEDDTRFLQCQKETDIVLCVNTSTTFFFVQRNFCSQDFLIFVKMESVLPSEKLEDMPNKMQGAISKL